MVLTFTQDNTILKHANAHRKTCFRYVKLLLSTGNEVDHMKWKKNENRQNDQKLFFRWVESGKSINSLNSCDANIFSVLSPLPRSFNYSYALAYGFDCNLVCLVTSVTIKTAVIRLHIYSSLAQSSQYRKKPQKKI